MVFFSRNIQYTIEYVYSIIVYDIINTLRVRGVVSARGAYWIYYNVLRCVYTTSRRSNVKTMLTVSSPVVAVVVTGRCN